LAASRFAADGLSADFVGISATAGASATGAVALEATRLTGRFVVGAAVAAGAGAALDATRFTGRFVGGAATPFTVRLGTTRFTARFVVGVFTATPFTVRLDTTRFTGRFVVAAALTAGAVLDATRFTARFVVGVALRGAAFDATRFTGRFVAGTAVAVALVAVRARTFLTPFRAPPLVVFALNSFFPALTFGATRDAVDFAVVARRFVVRSYGVPPPFTVDARFASYASATSVIPTIALTATAVAAIAVDRRFASSSSSLRASPSSRRVVARRAIVAFPRRASRFARRVVASRRRAGALGIVAAARDMSFASRARARVRARSPRRRESNRIIVQISSFHCLRIRNVFCVRLRYE
jgi:hypothetical protein